MKKKYFRPISIVLGIFLFIFLIINFGLNIWLKNNLADYIKNNSEYIVSYKKLDVDLGTGNIFLSGVTINNKNPENSAIIGFQGTVDTLSIARLGIIDAVFNKKISTSNLVLKKPNLNIILPKKTKNKNNKKQSEILLKNIKITNGNIQIFKATKQKFLSVKDFNLMVENLQMSEETAEEKLPFIFDQYEISGKNFFFRPDNVYAFTAKYITTNDGQMSLKDFAMTPLLSYANFTKFYPKKTNLFDFKTSQMEFKDILLKDDKITLSKVRFENPDLKMFTTDVKPLEKKKSFTYDVQLQDVLFNNAKINILNPNGTPLFAAGNLTMKINKFAMNKQTAKENIPFQYDDFSIAGQKVHYASPTQNVNIASLLINKKVADLRNISIKPTSSRPDKTLMDLAIHQVHLKIKEWNFVENNLKLNVENVLVNHLNGKITKSSYPKKTAKTTSGSTESPLSIKTKSKITSNKNHFASSDSKTVATNAEPSENKKNFTYDVQLENLLINNAKINILNQNGTPLFGAENLTMKINKFAMNEQTAKGNIPFRYNDFNITGQKLHYASSTQNMNIASLLINKKVADLRNISIKPTSSRPDKTLMDLAIQQIHLKINEWNFVENKLKLNIDNVLVKQLNGKITASNQPKKATKPNFAGIEFPLVIKNVSLKNSNLEYDKDNQPLVFKDLNANIQNIELNEKTSKESMPFEMGFYSLSSRNFNYKTKFYNMSSSLLKVNKNTIQVSNFAMLPRVSRAQFIRMIPAEKDLYDIKVNQIAVNGKWDFFSNNKFLDASEVKLNGVNANIFRSKIPKDDLSEKPLYSKLLRGIKIPMYIQNLAINNSLLIYEEDTKKSEGPGKLTFNNFNLVAKNINSGKMKGKPTQIPIAINCLFMNASPMNIKWSFDTANLSDAFAISGNVADLPASRINPFIEPYLKVRAKGLISDLIFNFKGNPKGLNGVLNMKHQNLKIVFIKKSGDNNKVLSAVANLFVKTNSGKYPEGVQVENVERDNTKSFFNLFWKGIEQGLKKTLIGVNAPKTEENIKKTVKETKIKVEHVKSDINKANTTVKDEFKSIKGQIKDSKKTKKNIFKKKSEN